MGAVCCRQTPIDFDGDVNLFHFVLLKAVGRGAFGKVRIVQHKQTHEMYALKYINKSTCVKKKSVAHVIQERRLLEEIDHPFIVNLRFAFQDDANCFFVLDLMLGGDLRFYLMTQESIPEERARFYVAELACALAYLQTKRIVHRDIKPDNILLDEKGHAHLTDFNIAAHYSENRLLTGVAGSMAYMAPEIFTKRGYSYSVDWWSLGIVAYELIFGKRPYSGRTNSELTNNISREPLRFPDDAETKCSPAGISALRAFLEHNPSKRLGCKPLGQGFEDVKRHPWFESINWELLESKQLTPPFIPDPKKMNFDPSYELEELLLEDHPLKATQRKADVEKMGVEMRQMEEEFTPYDFHKMRRRSYYPANQLVSTVTATSSSAGIPVTPEPPQHRPSTHTQEAVDTAAVASSPVIEAYEVPAEGEDNPAYATNAIVPVKEP